jgi:hypothetical protein
LLALDQVAVPALRKALEGQPTLELRRRAREVLDRLEAPLPPPRQLRHIRAALVLAQAGTPEARRLLEALAAGAPEARLTREAKASLGRTALPSRRDGGYNGGRP